MKKILALLLVVISLAACKKETSNNVYYAVGVDVQSHFFGDSVQVWLDGELIISKKMETFVALGVVTEGGMTDWSRKAGNHTIRAMVNGKAQKIETFNLTKDHYIGVNYDQQTSEVSFLHSDEPFAYD